MIEVRDIEKTRKEVSDLYNDRSDIVHAGVTRGIKPSQLITICKYATWSILGIFSLYSTGCKTIQEIDEEIIKFDSLISSKNSSAEVEVDLDVKVSLSLQRYWEAEAKRTGITITSVIIEALKARFGEPNQLENQISEGLDDTL